MKPQSLPANPSLGLPSLTLYAILKLQRQFVKSLKYNKNLSFIASVGDMNGSRNKTSQAAAGKEQKDADKAMESSNRDRKTGGGMLRKLKSRRSHTDKWPSVTEDELRALGTDISPDHVLGLRVVTEGIL
ncbi:hypothetical protein GOODEAATRI_030110 [Goodea atripinnis]|uniref:Uncharacterized protein n=1 Tax=Goodea atripinnis TaxID=208336 RepID=A0ABV0MWC4_9TELE